jgi:hypothetical protein
MNEYKSIDAAMKERQLAQADPEELRRIEEEENRLLLEESTMDPLIDKQEFNKEIAYSDEVEGDLQAESQDMLDDIQEEDSPVELQYEPILSQYRSNVMDRLSKAQDSRRNTLDIANALSGFNTVAQGVARGFGKEIGNDDAFVKQLIDQAEVPVKEIEELKKGTDVQLSMDLSDPTSDISKFAREQAASQMSKLNPNFDPNLFDNMSAAQLDKLGFKSVGAAGSSIRTPQQTDYESPDGQPLSYNPSEGVSGTFYNILTGKKYEGPLPRRKIINMFKDEATGNLMLRDRTNIMKIAPESATVTKAQTEAKITRKELAPKEKDLLDKTRESLTSDPSYKASKEATDGAENAIALLDGGKEIGGDLIRAVQTMLAKSAGNSGVMTEQDVAGFNGRADVISRLERAKKSLTENKLPEGDRKFLKKYANAMKRAARRNMLQVADLYKTQLSDDLGINNDQAAGLLNIEQRSDPKVNDEIRRKDPKTGKIAVFDKNKKFLRFED